MRMDEEFSPLYGVELFLGQQESQLICLPNRFVVRKKSLPLVAIAIPLAIMRYITQVAEIQRDSL